MTAEPITAVDFETELIRPMHLAPRWICGSFYDSDGLQVLGNHPDDGLRDRVLGLLADESRRLVFHNGASYDLNVIVKNDPSLQPIVWEALAAGRIHDTKIREKLLVIGDQGNMRLKRTPNGSWVQVLYDLSSLERTHLGTKGRKEEKTRLTKAMSQEGAARGDAWRYNFDTLDGMRAKDYPKDAWNYAAEDAKSTLQIFWAQQNKFASLGINPRAVEALHVAAAFCLYGMSAHGLRIDPAAVERLRARLAIDLGNDNDNIALLIAGGIIEPAKPERPHAGGHRSHVVGCKRKGCACPLVMVPAEKSKKNIQNLHALIVEVCLEHEITIEYTEETEKGGGGNVKADAEVMDNLKGKHPVIDAYIYRQNLLGLQDRELPRMTIPVDKPQVVHPHYDELKVTGRTSCSASENYPSGNIQNVDPRARECYIPRDGYLLLSVDVGSMELVTLAQVVYSLLGHSSLRDQINAGVDPHAFLGAQIAYAMHQEFRDGCRRAGRSSRMQIYEAFASMKDAPEDSEPGKLYKTYRTLAKPTGLGYPGGLGPRTFVALCKSGYGEELTKLGVVSPDLEQATMLRDLWLDVYPEMRTFFDIVKSRRDGVNDQMVIDKKTGQPRKNSKYWYVSPLGMRRNGCSFTEAANGTALQTPGAELAKLGMLSICRASWDYTAGSVLYRRLFPLAFIHDEILSEIYDDQYRHEVAMEKCRLMVEGGQRVVPDVKLTAGPALMRRWRKDAKGKFDKVTGLLQVWEPKEMLL